MLNKTLESQNQFINALKNPETQASAFTKLLADYKERLYWHIRKIVIEHDDADDVLQNTIALAAFIPVIIGMGGNIGTQSSTIIVRGLATGRVGFENSAKILFKEIRVGLILGILYGILLGLFAIFRFLEISPILGLVVGLSICASMLIAATIGSLVPLILDRFDIDPAVATGPFVTTAIDILGVALYFWIAGALFNLA